MPFQLLIDLTVDPLYGFVKALRIIMECGAENIKSDSERLFIHIDWEGNNKEFIQCISRINALASVEPRYRFYVCLYDENMDLRKVFKSLGYSLIPSALSTRVFAYRKLDESFTLVVEKTSHKDMFILRCVQGRVLPYMLTPSMYTIYGKLSDISTQVLKILELLERELHRLRHESEKLSISIRISDSMCVVS